MDGFTYKYDAVKKNKLYRISDGASNTAGYATDIDMPNQSNSINYEYNEIGELVEEREEAKGFEYNAAGLVRRVFSLSTNKDIATFTYNDKGLRHSKTSFNGGTAFKNTYYSYDAGGSQVASYTEDLTAATPAIVLLDLHLYGAGRVGLYNAASASALYELTDHLGNVRAVVKDDGSGQAETVSYTDYYPHGSIMPGRNYQSSLHFPYGYQGQEKDAETGLTNFELRQYDGRIGRWYNPDPMGQHHSPYLAMGNNPVSSIDPDGGWDDGFEPNLYEKYSNIYNPDAFGHSEFDNNYNHGGPLGGSINADGSFYSSDQQIYDAQVNNLKYNHSNEYFLDSNGDFAGVITTYGSYYGANGATVLDPTGKAAGEFSVKEYSQDEIFAHYGINKKDWETAFRNSKGGKVPVQGIDMGEAAHSRAVWKQYGKNFNDLADFSEKAVIGTFAGAGVAMTGGAVLFAYGGVEAAGATMVGAKAAPAVGKAILAACFVKGTQILTNNGLQNIEEINVNDLVFAYDTKNERTVTKKVLTLFEREVNRLIKLEYGNEVIYTTSEHPFYINNNWVKASDLKVGDLLFLYDKSNLSLQRISVIDTLVKVYNFTVEDEHNYYVGKNKVLVHNNECGVGAQALLKLAKKYGLNASSPTTKQLLENFGMRASDWVGKYRKGSIKSVLGDTGEKTIGEVFNAADSQIRKMILDGRFAK